MELAPKQTSRRMVQTINLPIQKTRNIWWFLPARSRWPKKISDTQDKLELTMFRVNGLDLRKQFSNRPYSRSYSQAAFCERFCVWKCMTSYTFKDDGVELTILWYGYGTMCKNEASSWLRPALNISHEHACCRVCKLTRLLSLLHPPWITVQIPSLKL